MKSVTLKCLVGAVVLAVIPSAANAVSFTSVPYDQYAPLLPPPAPGEAIVTDFNSTDLSGHPIVAPGYVLTYSGAGLYVPPLVSGIAAPVPTDQTQYMAVLSGGQATLTTPILKSLSVLLGSLDNYNQLTFKNLTGQVVASYNGYQLYPPANGDQFAQSTNREFYFTFDPSEKISEVDFASYGNSFEFDNIAASSISGGITADVLPSGVPEPSAWIMLISGFGLIGFTMRRRRKSYNSAFA